MPHPEHKPLLFGCWAKTKSVCRFQLSAERKMLLSFLCQRLSRWVDALGKASSPCEHMIVFRGTGPRPEDRRDVPMILLDCRYRPKMQYSGRCHLEGVSAGDRFVLPKDFPTLLQYNDACFNLSAADLEWKVVRLAWRWPEVAGTFFLMGIAAVGEESAKVEAAPIKKRRKLSKDNDF